jgi:hypothetical protein
MSDELKPCPFCGLEMFVEWRNMRQEPNTYLICKTEGCTAQNIHWDNNDLWNNRPIEDKLQARINELEEYNARLENTLERIANWTRAYPIDVFPEPDWERVREVLAAGGISIDCVSASNMRHVVDGIAKIIEEVTNE